MLKPWTVRRSRYVVRDEWIAVRADACVTPRGAELDPYYVLEYPDWIHLVAFDAAWRVLLIRLYRHALGAVSLEIPSGRMEPGETPEETARRELLEETGCAGERFTRLGSLTPNSATHANRSHCIAAFNCRPVQPPAPDEAEDILVEWVTVPELMALLDRGQFNQALQMAALLLGLRHAGFLRVEAPRP